jgi:hypothetical protein
MEPILAEQTLTKLSLAVLPIDDYTDKQPIGEIEFTLNEKEAIKNPSGYYLFLDLPPGNYKLKAQSQYYLDWEEDKSLPVLGEPSITITLKPNPWYPFPEGATLIRGMVKDADGKPVSEAVVRIIGKEIENSTTEQGEFVIYFKKLKEQDIIKVNKKRYVKGDGDQKLQLQVTYPNYNTKKVTVEAEEGKTTSVSITS